MSEFRSGNKAKSHPYPATPRGGGALAFARNFASGPALDTAFSLSSPQQINWNVKDSGSPPGVDVPITVRATGRFLISGMVSVENTSASPVNVQVTIQVNGLSLPVPASARSLLDAAPAENVSTIVIPFTTLLATGLLPGTAFNVQVLVSADDDVTTSSIVAESCTIEIQEITRAQ